MPRRELPLDPDGDALSQFAQGLRKLRDQAGRPTYRELSRRAHYAAGTLSDAASGRKLPTLAVTLAYVRACDGDVAGWEKTWHALAAELAAENVRPDQQESAGDAPYVGLGAFRVEDADRFFGREQVLDQLDGKLARHRFLAVFGPSGAGKSSLLRAGFVPRRTNSAVVLFSPGPHPFEECALQLAPLLRTTAARVHDELTSAPGTLRLLLRQAGPDGATVVVDQFEELFTLCTDPAERAAFLDALLPAASGATEVVVGVRADFYPHCAEHGGLAEAVAEAQLLLGPMAAAELREVIVKPAARAGLSVEGALVSELVAEAHAQPGALPLLSHVLLETWHRRQGMTLTLAGYRRTGGLEHALTRTAESVYNALPAEQRLVLRRVLLRLTALGEGTDDTRRRVPWRELAGDPDCVAVLAELTVARLVIVDRDSVELAHEALIRHWPRLQAWLAEDRDGLETHRQLTLATAAWEALGHDPGSLYRGRRLDTALAWLARDESAANDTERAFLAAGREAEHQDRLRARRRTRRLQTLVALLAILLLLSTGTTLYALHLQQVATEQQKLASSRQLAAEARNFLPLGSKHAAQLALAAYRVAPTDEARDALLSAAAALDTSRLPVFIGATAVALNPDASFVSDIDEQGNVHLLAMTPGKEGATLARRFGPGATVKFGGSGNLLTVADEEGVRVVDVTDPRRPVERSFFPQARYPEISPAGDLLTTSVLNLALHLYDITDLGHPHELRSFPAVDGMLFHPGGNVLLDQKNPPRTLPSQWWDRRPGGVPEPSRQLSLDLGFPIAFSPDGHLLITTDREHLQGKTRFWDIRDVSHPREIRSPDLGPWGGQPVFDSASRSMAVVDQDQTIQVVDLTDPGEIRITAKLVGHTGHILAMVFSPDSRHLISVGSEGIMRKWDTDIEAAVEQVAHSTP